MVQFLMAVCRERYLHLQQHPRSMFSTWAILTRLLALCLVTLLINASQ